MVSDKKILAVVHIYYPDQLDLIIHCLKNISLPYDLYVTIGTDDAQYVIDKISAIKSDCHFIRVNNVGYDVWPFVHVINNVDLSQYQYIIKLHTKRDMAVNSPIYLGNGFYMECGDCWRDSLYSFIATPENFNRCIAALDDPHVGMCARFNVIHNAPNYHGVVDWAATHCPQYTMGMQKYCFVAGTMFIAKAAPFQIIQDMHMDEHLFAQPTKTHETQLAHVIERTIGEIIYKSGMTITDPFTPDEDMKKINHLYRKIKRTKRIINYIALPIVIPSIRRRFKDVLFARYRPPYLVQLMQIDKEHFKRNLGGINMTKTISVIIPVYNTGKYLSRCLDSIIGQTFSNLEIICVNDGSTDNSAEILQEYANRDPRIRVITQKNAGLSAARNAGLKHITGEYVSFIDSDDWVDNNYYEYLINKIEQTGANIAMAGMRFADGARVSDNNTPNMVTADFIQKVKNLPNGSVCDKLFKTTLFRDIEFPRGRFYEDNIVLLKLMYLSDIVVFTNHVSYYYFMNQSGICRTTDESVTKKRTTDKLFFAREMMTFAHANKITSPEIQNFIVRTVASDFMSRESPYHHDIVKILGTRYCVCTRIKKFLQKIGHIFYQRNSRIRILRIPIARISK